MLCCAYKLCSIDYHLQQEVCYLEKVFIRNNFLKWVVKQIMKNVYNEQANPNTTTSLTTEAPSTTKSSLIFLP